jgi:hypothetical protein
MFKFFVIPVKTGIHGLLRSSWIALKSFTSCPGLRYAAPGMTGIPRSSTKKLEHRVTANEIFQIRIGHLIFLFGKVDIGPEIIKPDLFGSWMFGGWLVFKKNHVGLVIWEPPFFHKISLKIQ